MKRDYQDRRGHEDRQAQRSKEKDVAEAAQPTMLRVLRRIGVFDQPTKGLTTLP